jgi:hypothetical protein
MVRASLLSTTMLSGVVGGIFLATVTVQAADLQPVAPPAIYKAPPAIYDVYAPAVDGPNAKFNALGGSYINRSLYGAGGSLSIPLGGQFGFQFDGIGGAYDGRGMGAIGGHFFWRDPAKGLLGIYAAHTRWEVFGGVHVNQVAAEGEAYMGPFTIRGVLGVEWGNSVFNATATSVTIPPVVGGAGAFIATTATQGFEVRTRFFDKIDFVYYPLPDLKVLIGHRYLGGRHALALGSEFALPFSGPTKPALFAEARVGEGDFHGVWGGLKVYFGQKDKPLIRRHREDDPKDWTPEALGSIRPTGSSTTTVTPIAPLPPPPCVDCGPL